MSLNPSATETMTRIISAALAARTPYGDRVAERIMVGEPWDVTAGRISVEVMRSALEAAAACWLPWNPIADERKDLADGAPCWLYGPRYGVTVGQVDRRAAGGWSNGDTWEDFNGEVTHYAPMIQPEPPA